MSKKIIFLVLLCVFNVTHASKLSKYLHKLETDTRARQERERQEDMDFHDLDFRLENRYVNNAGEHCRSYVFRQRNRPYRHGTYTVCDEAFPFF